MKRTATDLRAHLYEVLDHVAATGEPVDIVRGSVTLSIVRKENVGKRKKSPRTIPGLIVGNSEELVHMEWPWNEGRDL